MTIPLSVLADLSILYTQPHRHYHNLEHIHRCLNEIDQYSTSLRVTKIAKLAIWFHDAIYNPFSKTNEEDSSNLLQSLNLPGFLEMETAAAVIAIRLTAKHTYDVDFASDRFTDEEIEAIKLTLDADLSGLGDLALYQLNGDRIRKEYQHVSDEDWKEGRAAFLEAMLARKSIYYLEYFRAKYEENARANMQQELDNLTK